LPRHGQLRPLFGGLTLQSGAIYGEQQLSPRDGLPFLKRHPFHLPGNARLYLDAVHRLNISHGRNIQRHIL